MGQFLCDLHDSHLNMLPYLFVQHEIGNGFLAIRKIEKHMFDAWSVGIFVGFDFDNVDILRL